MNKSNSARTPRFRLFIVIAALYLAQSLPTYLFAAALPPILRHQGVSRSAIGAMSLLILPLVLKFLWAPYVDRLRIPGLGHRRGWIIITQTGVCAMLVALAFVSPLNVPVIFATGVVLAILIGTQDIATDGYAMRHLAREDRAVGNAIQGGSVAIGVLVGGTLSLVLYGHIGWQWTVLLIAAAAALPLLISSWIVEDDDGLLEQGADHRRQRDIDGQASLKAFFLNPLSIQVLLFAMVYRCSEGLVKSMEGSYLVDIGVPLDWIGYLSGASAATAGLAGAAAAALLIRMTSARWTLFLLSVLRTVCFLVFALHANGIWQTHAVIFGAAAGQTIVRYMEIVALYSLFMAVASQKQPGTDFTILASGQLLVYLTGSFSAGIIADHIGYGPLFLIATGLSALSILATFMIPRPVSDD
ncbi:MAG: RhtX/FptX family siderophore transporter [Hyphomicrobiaceae bacterium]